MKLAGRPRFKTCYKMFDSYALHGLLSAFLITMTASVVGQTDFQPCPEEVLASWGEEVVLPALDVDRAWERADKEEELLGKHLYGIVLPHWAALGPEAHSTSHVVAVKVPGALGIAVHFDDFHLPPGVQMWVTNEAGTWEEGPYDFRDNDDHGRLATGDVPGESAVLRLVMPYGTADQVRLDRKSVV